MKELYIEGLASHNDHESCITRRKVCSEALTVAHTGRVLSPEILDILERRRSPMKRKAILNHAPICKVLQALRGRSNRTGQDLCTCGNSLNGNQESPWFASEDRAAARVGNPRGAIQR
jgi:hypothetical protein